VHLQASIADTWKPVLARFKQREAMLVSHNSRVSQAALHA
jgi:hypothetical protein